MSFAELPIDTQIKISNLIYDAPLWFISPNPQLGGRPPSELYGTPDWSMVLNILNAAEEGFFS